MTDAKPDRDGSAVSRAAMLGDPLDPSRERLGTWALYLGIAVSVSMLIGGAIFEVGPFAWSQGLVDRLFGRDSIVLAGLPMVALTLWLPIAVLGRIPRRPERAFLCGMQDAIDPKRNPNWKTRLPSSDARRRTLRRGRRIALVAAAGVAMAAIAGYRLTGQAPADAGRPLPRVTLAEITRSRVADLPSPVRLVDAEPGYDRAWRRSWWMRTSAYEDYYLPLYAPRQVRTDPVAVVMLASYPQSSEGIEADPPVPPLDGTLSAARLPAWMRARMREHGFEPARDALVFRRQRLDGRMPGTDPAGPALSLIVGGALVFSCLMMAWISTRSLGAMRPAR